MTHETRSSEPSKDVVLVVDDEAGICGALQAALPRRIRGLTVLTAGRPEQALDILANRKVDLILSDYKMPGMSGLAFLAEARLRNPGVLRVLMTAFPDDQMAIQAINEVRLEHFFTKPFRLEDVSAVVERLLDERRQKAQHHLAFARSLDAVRRSLELRESEAHAVKSVSSTAKTVRPHRMDLGELR